MAKRAGRQKKKTVKSSTRVSSRKEKTGRIRKEPTQRQKMAGKAFFTNVSKNTAENLLNNIDGKISQLSLNESSFSDQYQSLNQFLDRCKFPWSLSNFPSSFDTTSAHQSRGQEVTLECSENLSAKDRFMSSIYLKKNNVPTVPAKDMCIDNAHSANNLYNGMYKEDSSTSASPECNYKPDMSLEERKKLIGRKVPKVFVCKVCKDISNSFHDCLIHFHNNHPNVERSFFELEGEINLPPYFLENTYKQYNNPDGVLFSCPVPPLINESPLVQCTKCYSKFETSNDLYTHIIDCGRNKKVASKSGTSDFSKEN